MTPARTHDLLRLRPRPRAQAAGASDHEEALELFEGARQRGHSPLGCLRAASQTIDETTEKQVRLMSVMTNGPRRRFEDDGPLLPGAARERRRGRMPRERDRRSIRERPAAPRCVDSSRWRLFHRGIRTGQREHSSAAAMVRAVLAGAAARLEQPPRRDGFTDVSG